MAFKRLPILLMLIPWITMHAVPSLAEMETSQEYSFKISVERHLESKLNTVLREVTGIRHLVALVDAEVGPMESPPEEVRQEKEDINVLFLPGVPARPGSAYLAGEAARSQMGVRRLKVKVLVDRDVSKELTTMAHNVAIELVGYNPDRGDTLEIQKFGFMGGGGMGEFLSPPNIYLLLLSLPAAVFLVAASIFFLDPYRRLKAALAETGLEGKTRSGAGGAQAGPANAAPLPSGPQEFTPPPPEASGDQEADRSRPFGFLSGRQAGELMFALEGLGAEDLSIVLNYMDPAAAAGVLGIIGEELRGPAIEGLITTRQLDQGRVEALEERLRNRISLMSGGDDRLSSILENAEDMLRDSLMETIIRADSSAASRIGNRVRTFESVIRSAKPESIDALVRRFPPAAFARVLASSPGDVQGRVLDSMAKGASELMKEELKFARPLPASRLRGEKRRVIDEFLAMSRAGLIDEQGAEGV